MTIRPPRRAGLTVLVLILVMLGCAASLLIARSALVQRTHRSEVAWLLGENATLSCRAVLRRARGRLLELATAPEDGGFGRLRERLLTGTGPVDLTDLIGGVDVESALSWRRPSEHAAAPIGQLRLLELSCTVPQSLGLSDDAGKSPGDERVGVLLLHAKLEARLAECAEVRSLTEAFELRVIVSGPPRPFDSMGLYLGSLAAVTDVKAANRSRDKLLQILDEAVSLLNVDPTRLEPKVQSALREIRAGIPGPNSKDRTVLALPEEPAVLIGGLNKGNTISLAALDLAAGLEGDVSRAVAALEAFRAATDTRHSDGGARVAAEGRSLVQAVNAGLTRLWGYQRAFRILPRSDASFEPQLGLYEGRLTSGWIGQRTVVDLDPVDPVLSDWNSGARALHGGFRVQSAGELELTGEAHGRSILHVRAPVVNVHDLGPRAGSGELTTILVDGGRVRLSGAVRACLILTGASSLEVTPGACLTGALLVNGPAVRLQLRGSLVSHDSTLAGTRLASALARPGWGAYAVCLSPAPLWTQGERQ